MFQIPIRRPLVRWADCPGRVIASRRYRATSGRLIAIARPSVPDAPLMALCCGSNRLIIPEGLCCSNSPTLPAKHWYLLAYASHTYILDLLKQERQWSGEGHRDMHLHGPSVIISLSERYQGRIRVALGVDRGYRTCYNCIMNRRT